MSYIQSREPMPEPSPEVTVCGLGYERLGALAWALIALSFALVALSVWLA